MDRTHAALEHGGEAEWGMGRCDRMWEVGPLGPKDVEAYQLGRDVVGERYFWA